MNFTHRAKKSEVYFMGAWVVFWVAIAILFMVFHSEMRKEEASGDPIWPIVFFFSCISFFWCLSLFALLHAKRHRLHVTEEYVEQWGIFRYRKVDLGAVSLADWRRSMFNPKRIDLQTTDGNLIVSFQELSPEEAKELISFFRRRLPDAVQKNWDRFWEFNWKCFDEREPIPPEEIAAEQRSLKRTWLWSLSICLILLVVGDIFAWRYTEDAKWLWQPVVAGIGFAAMGYVFVRLGKRNDATRGRLMKTYPTPKLSRLAMVCVILGLSYPGTAMALRFFPRDSAEETFLIIVPMLLLFAPTVWELRKAEKQRQAWSRETAKRAAELYLEPRSN